MVLREDGQVKGSVSGGCIEDDLIRRVRDEGIPDTPQIVRYGVGVEEARRFGLPCGGAMRLVMEPLHQPDSLKELLERLNQGQRIARKLNLQTGEASLMPARAGQTIYLDEASLVSLFGPGYRLLIIGAGQVCSLLAQIALSLDFSVTVCDPRTEYAEGWSVDGATLVRTMPDDTVVAMKPDEHTAIVALTHDPKLDDMALMEALTHPAFYVAALGSRLNNNNRRERLKTLDLNESQIAELHGPAGIDIGSKTPAEIAVSIAAQLVAAKNGLNTQKSR